MEKKTQLLTVFLCALFFTVLFYHQSIGINLGLFEAGVLFWLYHSRQFKLSGINLITAFTGIIITAVSSVLFYSAFAIIVNILLMIVFTGVVMHPRIKSIINAFLLAWYNMVGSVILFSREISDRKFKGQKLGTLLSSFRIFALPVLLITVFYVIYKLSNPKFDQLTMQAGVFISDYFNLLFEQIDILIICTFIVGLYISIFLFYRKVDKDVLIDDQQSTEELYRKKKIYILNFSKTGLKNELRAAVFLLLALNAIILFLNVIDISWVWFNFEWNGGYLKQFVHEGTYLLILSILISIGIVLYFFRSNLNFHSKNNLLKWLCYAWIVQNAILAISVGIRNYWYIQYFNLAYKRIGVIVFLLLTIYGLFTVFMKVKNRKTTFFLLRKNSYALIIVLVACSLINWDNYIAKYNIKHSDRAFLHLDYLSELSDKSLPYLELPLEQLNAIHVRQKVQFPSEVRYMAPEHYLKIIKYRKEVFEGKWESKGILSWNLAEYQAYKALFPER